MPAADPARRTWLRALADHLHRYPDDHLLQISIRTYAVALFLSLSPPVMSFLMSPNTRAKGVPSLLRVCRKQLGVTGFAFAMTLAVGGGSALRSAFIRDSDSGTAETRRQQLDEPAARANSHRKQLADLFSRLKNSHKTLLAYLISSSAAIALLQYPSTRRHSGAKATSRPSPTLDLTLLLLVRALDCIVRLRFLPSVRPVTNGETLDAAERAQIHAKRQLYTRNIDAFVFWASSARIMWCFFYEPHRLPHSYNKWIMSLANIDPRILHALRAIRAGNLSYIRGVCSPPDLLTSFSRDLGYPAAWGDLSRLPAYGGPSADEAWKGLGVTTRSGVGGIPCEFVHGTVTGPSCTVNAALRGVYVFVEAVAIYLPVHVLPILLTKPHKLLQSTSLLKILLAVFRSASFLSTFVSSIFYAICLTRTLLIARLLPSVPHDFWDGPLGCTFVGSLVCGASIWIEQGRRRGEMALYVLPRAIRACLSDGFLRSGKGVRLLEKATFVLSLATLLTVSWHEKDSLRGLSRWTLAFIMRGPNAGFWKRKRQEVSEPGSPELAPTNGVSSHQKH